MLYIKRSEPEKQKGEFGRIKAQCKQRKRKLTFTKLYNVPGPCQVLGWYHFFKTHKILLYFQLYS
jgi:hypothetical protein